MAAATLGFAIAGLGRMGATLAPAFRNHPGVRLVAGADLSQPLVDRLSGDFGATGYTSFEALCADRRWTWCASARPRTCTRSTC